MEPFSRPGELAYYDGAGVVCRCWNWRDGQRTAIKDDTACEFIAMECVDPDRMDALDELAGLLEKYANAKTIAKGVVTADCPEMVIQG